MDLGSTEQSIAKQAIRSGQPIPDRIKKAPQLRIGLIFFLQAFFDLDSERPQGFGLGRIPWLAIQHYGAYYKLDEDQSDALLHFVQAMDVAYLRWRDDKDTKHGKS